MAQRVNADSNEDRSPYNTFWPSIHFQARKWGLAEDYYPQLPCAGLWGGPSNAGPYSNVSEDEFSKIPKFINIFGA